ncbi:prephenate dehydrogenase [Paracoccus seriniphilus]|uniref:Prephenate dehydrogenase n=1 Tax=Paracoccus seriniphilus TaxID=184748 RepID=A0A239PYS1_9RHOB|nr:prephenate dehydrogenase [Paracoccus seriniphilus]WCR14572.1 prephenate dehydrogenase [Paracoccus seriniphilus]SNT75126.1 prephenate dehydrogenase [Paracoccus seriniphilus]
MNSRQRLAIIGFGAFGRLIARHLRPHLSVCVCDPHHRSNDLPQVDLVVAASCDIVVLAVPLSQFETVLQQIAPHLRPGTIVMDVASVKVEPARAMQQILPEHVQIIATHPLFGPESARDGIAGHRLAWCPLRGTAHRRVAALLRFLGLQLIATTPDEHDRDMAVVQGLTHLIARSLDQMARPTTRLTTESYRRLAEAVAMVRADSPELLHMILEANPYARPARQKFLATATQIGTVA